MKKSFTNQQDITEIFSRLQSLEPNSQRQWGRMTPHQMMCHLSDAYQMGMGEREAAWAGNFLTTTVLKYVALQVPIKWAKGFKTGPAADQEIGGTKPVEFERDRQKLTTLIHRFVADTRDFQFVPHPVFGAMSVEDWMRWGYLHADHHLRQFGL